MSRGSRASGTNPRALGTNPRALGADLKANRRVLSKAERMGWNPPAKGAGLPLPSWLRFEVLKRDGFACRYCGATPKDGARLQVDHIKPRAAGGRDEPTNLTTACSTCNGGKADDLTRDHVIPRSRGGSDEISNKVWACRSCNSAKGDRTPEEWLG